MNNYIQGQFTIIPYVKSILQSDYFDIQKIDLMDYDIKKQQNDGFNVSNQNNSKHHYLKHQQSNQNDNHNHNHNHNHNPNDNPNNHNYNTNNNTNFSDMSYSMHIDKEQMRLLNEMRTNTINTKSIHY